MCMRTNRRRPVLFASIMQAKNSFMFSNAITDRII
ncbi:hypothetical protein EVA_11269 [gut metagenome]|uniref:Uncharacterized protein n=1 Tax=gut metagenome TaxID=749906 RepID=J9G1B8_9ZZZZ